MGCNAPLTAYKTPDGAITFNNKLGYYDRPLKLACGQCRGCRLRRTRDWAIRAIHESQMHKRSSFITLTYRDEDLPEDHGLVLKHWQNFAKKLRRQDGPFRFLHCGEYGDQSFRPHYHALIFGHNFHEDRVPINNNSGHPLYASSSLALLWPWGFSSIGEVAFDSAAYVASYVFKKKNGEQAEKINERLDITTGELWSVPSPYATMSRRPGLGTSWFHKYKGDLYPHDFAVAKGQKFRPPKFYDQLLQKEDPKMWEEIQNRRRHHVRSNPTELEPQKLDIKEETLRRKHELYAHRHL